MQGEHPGETVRADASQEVFEISRADGERCADEEGLAALTGPSQNAPGIQCQHLEGVAVARCDDPGAPVAPGGVEIDERGKGAAQIAYVFGLRSLERCPDRSRMLHRLRVVLVEHHPAVADRALGPGLERGDGIAQAGWRVPLLHRGEVERRHP